MKNTIIGTLRYLFGEQPSISTFIDEDTITMGYGVHYGTGDFEYPVHNFFIRMKYGTLSWRKYFNE